MLSPFVTSLTPNMAQNGPKIIKNNIKLDKTLVFSSYLVLTCFFGVGQLMVVLEFQSVKILTPFETLLSPKVAQDGQNDPKISIKDIIKLIKMTFFISHFVLMYFLG